MTTSRPDEMTDATARYLRAREAYLRERPTSRACDDQRTVRYLRAREAYLRALYRGHTTWRERLADAWDFFRAVVWPRISHAAIGLAIILVTFVVLLIGCATTAKGAEGRWTMAEVTCYCPCSLCCGDFADGYTANMTRVARVPYAFAADRSLPFGARVYVPPGMGVLDVVRADDRWFAVDDRGGALDTEARRYAVLRLDLRVREHGWAVRFGRRTLPVFVVLP